MISGIIILILALVLGSYLFYLWRKQLLLTKPNAKRILTIASIIIAAIIIPLFQPYKVEKVDAGHTGLVVQHVGSQSGVQSITQSTGYVLINSYFSTLVEIPTYELQVEYEKTDVICKGGMLVSIHPTMSARVITEAAPDMYVNLRQNVDVIINRWLKNAIISAMADITNKWHVEDIFTDREKFEAEIIAEANKRVSKWFVISNLRTNIIPPASLVKSIEAKTNAVQQVEVANSEKLVAIARGEMQVTAAIAEGKTRIATAKADSAEAVIRASGEAQAIKLQQTQLSPIYVDYLKVNKWDGKLPTYTGNGMPMLKLN